jgi:hypothetical protein
MSKQSWYVFGGIALLVVILLMMSSQKTVAAKASSGVTLGGLGGVLSGVTSLGNAAAGWFGGSSGGYSPDVTRGEDATIGGDSEGG